MNTAATRRRLIQRKAHELAIARSRRHGQQNLDNIHEESPDINQELNDSSSNNQSSTEG